ncbi:hypothetical protein KBY66_09660 [Synechococcus sp. Tobar12-5m-g]|uniref:hypothetical protein n=1 Tax=unclassified Synechococcus TaxID=2626047 RepID=UPI0020CFA2FD|nr:MULTISPECIES: hypothetical protein [unclassified Synechococcus]MCP9772893.1 hypothetical protein [Synechococcus sp. Tobar12-5m-g]MCP9873794.1 hypothetical protein [Synechococcus sp. Cruz CV-v-12]
MDGLSLLCGIDEDISMICAFHQQGLIGRHVDLHLIAVDADQASIEDLAFSASMGQ